MLRAEALPLLKGILRGLYPGSEFHKAMQCAVDILSDPPCACGGKEPIERGKRWASTVDPCCYSMVRGGHYKNLVEIMVFALPGEKPE